MNNWFKHSDNARNDERIQALRMSHGVEGYGLYLYIIEIMHENLAAKLSKEKLQLIYETTGTKPSKCQAIVSKCLALGLFQEDDSYLFCKRAEGNIQERIEISEKRRESGRMGGFRKANAKQTLANAKQLPSREEKRRVEKIREDKNIIHKRENTPAHDAKDFFANTERQSSLVTLLTQQGADVGKVRAELDKFIRYWTEPNRTGTRERWELEKTFDVKRRLNTWFERAGDFNKRSTGRKTTIIS